MNKDEYSLEALIVGLVESQKYMNLDKLLKVYIKDNQTAEPLNSLSAYIRNAIKSLFFNTNIEDIEYCENDIDSHDDRGLPVRLECTKHVKNIKVDDDFCFSEVGQRLWIYKSNGAAQKFDDRNPAKIITLKSLKPKPME